MKSFDENQKSIKQGFIIALVSAIVLSFTGIIIRFLSENYAMPALILAFWRDFFVVLCLLPIFTLFNSQLFKVKRENYPYLVLFGFVLAIFNIFWTLTVTLMGAAVATVLVYSSAGFTALLGHWILGEELGFLKAFAVILSLIGCVFVSGATNPIAWQTNPLGIVTGLLSGLLYAVYSLMGRRATQKNINPWTTLFYTFLFAMVFLLVINLAPLNNLPGTAQTVTNLFFLRNEWMAWLLLLLLACGPTLIGFGMYNISLGKLPSSTANLILTLEPVFTIITAYLLLGERLTQFEIIGSTLILLALILLRIHQLRQRSFAHSS
jgi:drug/metabolite transporter (DMT)-like permease